MYEFDFVIVNYTHQYIMNIEVKKWLGKIQNKDIDIGKEVREQLEKIGLIIFFLCSRDKLCDHLSIRI